MSSEQSETRTLRFPLPRTFEENIDKRPEGDYFLEGTPDELLKLADRIEREVDNSER